MIVSRYAAVCAALATVAVSSNALAASQAASDAAPAVEAETAETDIVVTANKREQRLNDVGLTVAVVSGEALQNKQINTLADLAQAIPSLSFTNSANGTPVYTLRGVGFYETSLAAYPTVSTYIDEAPLAFPVLSSHSAFDLERVEVLKGPQGTLFGQNATGGAINYIAAKPTDTLTAGGSLSYGRFNEIIGEGFVSGPISETLKARLAGRIEHADGWQVSNSRPGDRNGKVKNYMGRLLVDFEPADGARFLLNLNGWQDKSETQAPQYIAFNPQLPFFVPGLTDAAFSPDKPRAADWTPGVPHANNRFYQASLRADIDLTSSITLTSLTSYVDYKQRQGDDGDGLPIQSLDLLDDNGRIKTFSQELRLSNGALGALRWVVGGNYEKSTVDQLINLDFRDSTSTTAYGFLVGYPLFSLRYQGDQKLKNYAFFGNAEYDVASTITLKGGIRYTNSSRSVTICSRDLSGIPTNTGPLFFDILLGGALGPYAGQCYPINNLPYTVGTVAPGAPGAYTGKLHEDNISWRVGVDFKPRPGLLFYGNVAKGYKAGSYPTLSASIFEQYLPVTQESVLSYEAGFKATLLDRALQFNGAAFYYDYKDKQLRSKLVDPFFGILDTLQNIPKSSIKGFELELSARPTPGLTVNTAFTYIDATIDRFTGINSGGVTADFAGKAVPYTPKYQIGTNVDYDFAVSGRMNAFVGAGLSFRSDTVATIGGETNPPGVTSPTTQVFKIKDYALLDLRLGLRGADDSWRLSVWGKNVLNEYYWNNIVATFDTLSRYAGRPATYGVTVSVRYR